MRDITELSWHYICKIIIILSRNIYSIENKLISTVILVEQGSLIELPKKRSTICDLNYANEHQPL